MSTAGGHLEFSIGPKSNNTWLAACNDQSSLKIAHFVPIHEQTWPPQAILVSDWSIF
jgi:hypothetical protein